MPEHLPHLGLGFEVGDHRLIPARQRTQHGVVVRVGQHAHIENIVRIDRYAALEGKGLEHQGQAAAGHGHQGLDIALELGSADEAGVDHMGLVAQVGQQFTLQLDGLHQRALLVLHVAVGQRVAAAGF